MDIERKSIAIELKESQEGAFVARIATLNVIDKDGDVTLPGAFTEGKTIPISAYMHGSWQGKLTTGIATLHEMGNEVLADGLFNLKTIGGRDTYETVKFNKEHNVNTEWSYGFYPLIAPRGEFEGQEVRLLKKLDEKEISPVLVGAGVDTALLAIKSGKPYEDQAESVLAAVNDLVARTKSLADLRLKEGRTLSTANRNRMMRLMEMMSEMQTDMQELMDSTAPKDGKALIQAALLYTKIRRNLAEVI